MAASGTELPSIVIFRLHGIRAERVSGYLEQILTEHVEMLEQGVGVSVSERQIRLQNLPI